MRIVTLLALVAPSVAFALAANAAELRTNQAVMSEPPAWLKAGRVQRVIDRMEYALEWDIRKIQVRFYVDAAVFQRTHGYDASVLAFARAEDHSVHLGPRVDFKNFEAVFGHELVHVIIQQKYKNSIPRWLEEGLANHLAKFGTIDYAWLASRPTRDVTALAHPFHAQADGARYHYAASTAVMELIASRCKVQDLLQLSVGKKLETYLGTFCDIKNLNADFQAWVQRKAREKKHERAPR